MEPTILSFIVNAGPLVKLVMSVLFMASVVSWTVIMRRYRFFKQLEQALRAFDKCFAGGSDPVKMYTSLRGRKNGLCGVEKIFYTGFQEFLLARKRATVNGGLEAPSVSADRAMSIVVDREVLELQKGLPILATIGSVSPYVGLFGTVWGIMTSFRSLSGLQQATIAMVAPGISEALIATAIGLFAAIPAVVAYNRFSVSAERMAELYSIYQAEVSKLLHQQGG